MVVEFKRGVYEMALTELARYLPRNDQRNRFLRQGHRLRENEPLPSTRETGNHGMELPPGASFNPDPQSDQPGKDRTEPQGQ